VKHIEAPDSALARVGAVESCWLSDRRHVQVDSALGLPEEIEPQAEVLYRIRTRLKGHQRGDGVERAVGRRTELRMRQAGRVAFVTVVLGPIDLFVACIERRRANWLRRETLTVW
jgi:hypothetical protein